MIDHLLRFASEAEAAAALPAYRDAAGWVGACCLPGVTVLVDGALVLPGWHLIIARETVDAGLTGLAGGACRFAADREASEAGRPSLLYVAVDLDLGLLARASVSPVFAGSGYYG